jgi:AICAR transformylase/IMP cyclohydrolase PurH
MVATEIVKTIVEAVIAPNVKDTALSILKTKEKSSLLKIVYVIKKTNLWEKKGLKKEVYHSCRSLNSSQTCHGKVSRRYLEHLQGMS